MGKIVKKVIVILLIVVMTISSSNVNSEAAAKKNGLKAPSIGSWKTKTNINASGTTYTIKWKKVKGAKGYQVKLSERSDGLDWWTRTYTTRKRSASLGGSSLDAVRAKVRAYKIVNGRKKYGPWSKAKTLRYD